MAAVQQEIRHCLIWFGQCPPHARQLLSSEGWSLREHLPAMPFSLGLRGQGYVAALFDLASIPVGQLPTLLKNLANSAQLPRLCVLPEGSASSHRYWLPVSRQCDVVLHAPLQDQHLSDALQTLLECGLHSSPTPLAKLIGQSPAMLQTRSTLRKYAVVDLPVLITGQTGTGKELAAHALHHLSLRAQKPMVAVNCGAIPASLIQSELFGHERGAFTGANARRQGLFEHADGGTVFLDEVGDLPADAQTALLRVLQEGTLERIGSHTPIRINVRVLAATHIDLEQAISNGRFRNDLYYRLNVLRLHMPPLSQRGNDIVLLAEHALHDFRQRHSNRARGFSSACLSAMARWPWPGNARELINRVQRAAVICENELIQPQDMELAPVSDPSVRSDGPLHCARRQAEREALVHCLHEHDFNISAAARAMGISRVTIYRLCRRHAIERQAAQPATAEGQNA